MFALLDTFLEEGTKSDLRRRTVERGLHSVALCCFGESGGWNPSEMRTNAARVACRVGACERLVVSQPYRLQGIVIARRWGIRECMIVGLHLGS